MLCAMTLYFTLIENYPGKIDHLIAPIMQLVLQNLQMQAAKQWKVVNYQVIALALW